MPVTSTQISGMIGGQQAMFGNVATYAHQISPFGGGGGNMPTYSNPMAGAGYGPAAADYNAGAQAAPGMIHGAMSYGMPIMAGAGMMMGGPMGAMMDPFTGAMAGAGKAVGWTRGATIGANLGRVASLGVRAIPRIAGGAAVGAMPALAVAQLLKYIGGQAMEGAQFQNQTSGFLQQAFRFTNPASRTGMGFSQHGMRNIGEMLQNMGFEDVMSTPQEMLQIMKRGTGMGVFRGVQDAREFKQRFKEMKNTLTEIASTFNTTLSEALPFFQNARQQGFWTPQDITRHARQVRQVQATTGMSTAQAQAMTAIGAQMVRGIGGTGQQGAQMMARAQGLTGAALYGGTITDQTMQEAGFGTGAAGAQNMGQMLAGMSARFARSRVGRWALAAMMNEEGTGLDPARMGQFTAGGMSVGRMGALARRNVSGGRAYRFVENEEELRGQLAAQGPQAVLGMVRSLTGGRLYGGSSRDRLISRRIIQRFMGGTKRQAEMIARLAQDLPRLMEIQAAKTENSLDMQERQRETAMNDTLEGMKRKIGHWWETNINAPLQKGGAEFSHRVGRTWQRWMDNLMGTGGKTVQMSDAAVRAMSVAATTGDMSALTSTFGSQRLRQQIDSGTFTGAGRGFDFGRSEQMMRLGFAPTGIYRGQGIGRLLFPMSGLTFRGQDVRAAQNIMSARAGGVGEGEAQAAGYGSTQELISAQQGAAAEGIKNFLTSNFATIARGRFTGLRGEFDAESNRMYARFMVNQIRRGAAGTEAQQALEGLGQREAMTRVMALQGRARGAMGGLTPEGMTGMGAVGTRAQIEEQREDAIDNLTTALRGGSSFQDFLTGGATAVQAGGIRGVGVTAKGVQELTQNSDGAAAMRLFAEARSMERAKAQGDDTISAEEIQKKKNEARNALGALARMGEKSGLSRDALSAAISLMQGGPEGANAENAAADVGEALVKQNLFARDEKYQRRMQRFRDRLGSEGRKRLEAATKATKPNERRLGETLSALMEGRARTPEDQVRLMRDLASEAARSPEAAARISQVLQEEGLGATEIGVVLRGGMETAGDIQRFAVEEGGGGPMRKMFGGAASMLARMGIRVGKGKGMLSAEDLRKVIRGDSKDAQQRVREMLEARLGEGRGEEILESLKGGLTRDEMLKHMTAAEAGRGLRTYSDRVAKEAGLEKGAVNMTGREGSPQFIGEQLRLQTELQRRQLESMNALNEKLGAEVKKYKEK